MHAEFNLTELAIVALMALGCGIVFERMRQPAVLGYILAGLLLGPSVLGLVENRELVSILAEIGVLLLLFLVGLELDLNDFKKVWLIAMGCTLFQITGSLAVVALVGKIFDLSAGLSLVLGCAIALSSTAVAVKMMDNIGELKTAAGRITLGVLIAQDLAIVPMMLVLRSLGEGGILDISIATQLVISVGLLAALIMILGRRKKIDLPFANVLKQQEELLPLLCLGFCFGLSALAGLWGLSAAYGAFLAGLILGNTTAHHALIQSTKPIQSVFLMVFFLSVGLLLDLQFIWAHIWTVLVLLFIITIGKTLFNIAVLRFLGKAWPRAFLAGLLLAQMGEFTFLLTTLGVSARLITLEESKMIISLAALSLSFSPLWLVAARRVHDIGPAQRFLSLRQTFDRAFQVDWASWGNYARKSRLSVDRIWHASRLGLQAGFQRVRDRRKSPHD